MWIGPLLRGPYYARISSGTSTQAAGDIFNMGESGAPLFVHNSFVIYSNGCFLCFAIGVRGYPMGEAFTDRYLHTYEKLRF